MYPDNQPYPAMYGQPAQAIPQPLTEDDFRRQYWFSAYQLITIVNPTTSDYQFLHEGRYFMLAAGEQHPYPGPIANTYLDQMSKIIAQQEDNLKAWSDPDIRKKWYDRLIADVQSLIPQSQAAAPWAIPGQPFVPDAASGEPAPWEAGHGERASDLARATRGRVPQAPAVSVMNPVRQRPSFNAPAYPPQFTPQAPAVNTPPHPAFEQQPQTAAAPPQAPVTTPEAPQTPPQTAPATADKPKNEVFTLEGANYHMTETKTGQKLHYRDGKLISAADYAKAVSLL